MINFLKIIAVFSLFSNIVLVVLFHNTVVIANEQFQKLNGDGGKE